MQPWMRGDATTVIPTANQVLIRLLTEVDKCVQKLPVDFKDHHPCLVAVCKSIRTMMIDPEPPIEVVFVLNERCHEHMGYCIKEYRTNRSWDVLFRWIVWGALDHAVTVIVGAMGHGIEKTMSGGTHLCKGSDAAIFGLAGVVTHLNVLRHCCANPALTYENPDAPLPKSFADIQGIENLGETRPQWVLDLVDVDIPEGCRKVSELMYESRLVLTPSLAQMIR